MTQSGALVGALVAGFILWLALNRKLQNYWSILAGGSPGTTTGPAATAPATTGPATGSSIFPQGIPGMSPGLFNDLGTFLDQPGFIPGSGFLHDFLFGSGG